MKKHVAIIVAAPKHMQGTQEYSVYNRKKEEPNKTHGENEVNLFVRLPPSNPYAITACHLKLLTGGVAILTNPIC